MYMYKCTKKCTKVEMDFWGIATWPRNDFGVQRRGDRVFSFLKSVMVILHVFLDFSMTVRSADVDRFTSTRTTECLDGFK